VKNIQFAELVRYRTIDFAIAIAFLAIIDCVSIAQVNAVNSSRSSFSSTLMDSQNQTYEEYFNRIASKNQPRDVIDNAKLRAENFTPEEIRFLDRLQSNRVHIDQENLTEQPISISAHFLHWVLLNAQANKLVKAGTLAFTNVTITDTLELQHLAFDYGIDFRRCTFSGAVVLDSSSFTRLSFSRCTLQGIYAPFASFEQDLSLNNCVVNAEVILNDAIFRRNLIFAGTTVLKDGGRGSILTRSTLGFIPYISRQIVGLHAPRIRVGGCVFIEGSNEFSKKEPLYFHCNGPLDFSDSKIEGNIEFSRAVIDRAVFDETAISLAGAKIDRHLAFTACKVIGTVVLDQAFVGGTFDWDIEDDPTSKAGVQLNLDGMKVQAFRDRKESWPKKSYLSIDGFEYDQIGTVHFDIDGRPVKAIPARDRLEWLERLDDSDYSPQPFEQLAGALKAAGADDVARSVLKKKEIARLKSERQSIGTPTKSMDDNAQNTQATSITGLYILTAEYVRFWFETLTGVIGYGYNPLAALPYAFGVISFGACVFGLGYYLGCITPTDPGASNVSNNLIEIHPLYPKFNPIVFSLDVFLPLIDLHQGTSWSPNPNFGPKVFGEKFYLRWSALLRMYFWIHIIVGWFMATVVAVGITNLVRT